MCDSYSSRGAIAVIRVSGENAIAITDRIFQPVSNGKKLAERKPYTLTFGQILNEQKEVIDEVLISIFHAPHSYTERIQWKFPAMVRLIFCSR